MVGTKINELREMLEVVKEEGENAVKDYKKNSPAFQRALDKLFSEDIDSNIFSSRLARLIMDYAQFPQNALFLIPQFTKIFQDLSTARREHNKSMKFPRLFPAPLNFWRKNYKDNKQQLNELYFKLILIAGIATDETRSIWSSLQSVEYTNENTKGDAI